MFFQIANYGPITNLNSTNDANLKRQEPDIESNEKNYKINKQRTRLMGIWFPKLENHSI